MEKIKVCTFNLRMEVKGDGINMFTNRTPYIREAIRRESPDIIGFQEVRPHMLVWLRDTFPEYTVVGAGRGSEYKDESNPVLFKKDKFDFISYDMFWLSKTPFVPGTLYDDNCGCPRICVVITLKLAEGEKLFRVYNTHLDHVSDEARKNGIKMILERMDKDDERIKVPQLLMGDMNAYPDSLPIQYVMTCDNRKFQDLTSEIKTTYHAYGTHSAKIDYIFASGNVTGSDAKVWDDCHDGVYLSDHYPVSVDVELN